MTLFIIHRSSLIVVTYGTATPAPNRRSARRHAAPTLADAGRARAGPQRAPRPVPAAALHGAGQLRPAAAPGAVRRGGRAGAGPDRLALRAGRARPGLVGPWSHRRYARRDRAAGPALCDRRARPQPAADRPGPQPGGAAAAGPRRGGARPRRNTARRGRRRRCAAAAVPAAGWGRVSSGEWARDRFAGTNREQRTKNKEQRANNPGSRSTQRATRLT